MRKGQQINTSHFGVVTSVVTFLALLAGPLLGFGRNPLGIHEPERRNPIAESQSHSDGARPCRAVARRKPKPGVAPKAFGVTLGYRATPISTATRLRRLAFCDVRPSSQPRGGRKS